MILVQSSNGLLNVLKVLQKADHFWSASQQDCSRLELSAGRRNDLEGIHNPKFAGSSQPNGYEGLTRSG
ncbi:unnamed protein product [Linum trigynum]|uniref:Uncharacterized protein n=1 Tax=Linum trigynum TaxID=586398 RepID=A0AAV2CFL1_9ROSI